MASKSEWEERWGRYFTAFKHPLVSEHDKEQVEMAGNYLDSHPLGQESVVEVLEREGEYRALEILKNMGLLDSFLPTNWEEEEKKQEKMRDEVIFPLLNEAHKFLHQGDPPEEKVRKIKTLFKRHRIDLNLKIVLREEDKTVNVYPQDALSWFVWLCFVQHNPRASF